MRKDNRSLRLLLIEDNPGDALLVEEFLGESFENVNLTEVSTYKEAEKILLPPKERYDSILLDLSLPDSDGIELVQQILDLAGSVPVIVLTGYSNLDFSIESLSKGISDYLLKDELSSTLLYKSIVYSIERNAYSEKLRKSEQNYRHLFEFSPEPMWVYDLNTLKFLDVNKAATEHYGYSKDEFLEMTIHDIRPADEIEGLEKSLSEIRSSPEEIGFGVYRHQKKDGEIIQVEVEGSGIEYRDRMARLVLADDITEKLQEEQRLKQLESVVTHTTESVVILEPEPAEEKGRNILYVNDAFTEMTQYSREDALGRTLHFLNGPETNRDEIERLKKGMDRWEICNVEYINYRKDGTPFWINTSMVPVAGKDGNYIQWVAIGRDITKQKKYEKKLEDSLAEKEVLLSEIHHRVKNNLAVISSLMQLQAFNANSKELEEKLYDSVFRISTMATIHEILYKSGSFSKLNFSDVLGELVTNLEKVFGGSKEIEHEINSQDMELNINQAIPCSLLINEVVTNVYKHAFEGRSGGVLKAELTINSGKVVVEIADNGVGMPQDVDIENSDSMGLTLINVLTAQLKGESEFISNGNGTVFRLQFEKTDVAGVGSNMVK